MVQVNSLLTNWATAMEFVQYMYMQLRGPLDEINIQQPWPTVEGHKVNKTYYI